MASAQDWLVKNKKALKMSLLGFTLLVVLVAMIVGAVTLSTVNIGLDKLENGGYGAGPAVVASSSKAASSVPAAAVKPKLPVPAGGGVGLASNSGPSVIPGGLGKAKPARGGASLAASQPPTTSEGVPPLVTLNADTAKQLLDSAVPIVIIVYSGKCGHCVVLKDKLEKMAQDGSLAGKRVGLLNHAELQKDAKLASVLATPSVPALFKVHHGRVHDVKRGNLSKPELLAYL